MLRIAVILIRNGGVFLDIPSSPKVVGNGQNSFRRKVLTK